ncbi:MAG: NAD(P)-binding protein [Candidatus Micrarchaeaceae archaeon]
MSKVIVCGFGTFGKALTKMLREHGINTVVIDAKKELEETVKETGAYFINGDATNLETLKRARAEDADAIAIALDDDAKNLFVVINARTLNKKAVIVARVNEEFVKEKLIEAGANYVVMPMKAAAKEIAEELERM